MKIPVLGAAKRTLGFCAAYSGGLALLRAFRYGSASRALVFGYHGIGRSEDCGQGVGPEVTGVSPEQFDRQVHWLRRSHNFIPLEALAEHVVDGRPLPPRAVAITFDDGYANLYYHAFETLHRYSVPATVFLVSGMVGKHEQFLSWPQVREMNQAGISFGAHTVSHPYLTKLAREEAKKEVAESKAEIEYRLGCSVNTFSYPHGALNDVIARTVAETGFMCAVTTLYGSNDCRSNPFFLKRLMTGDDEPLYMFIAREAGMFDLFHHPLVKKNEASHAGQGKWELKI